MPLGEIIGALAAGTFVGSILGFIGAGGAMLTVPLLLYGFHFTAVAATTAALAVVFIAALVGVIPKARRGDVLYREALTVWGLGLITNIGGGIIAKHLPSAFLTSGFAFFLVIAGASMLKGTPKDHPERRMPLAILVIVSLVIGAMTGLFGIGGGFLAIPILVLFFHTPQNKAAGTSLLIIALNCLTSFLAHHAVWKEISWHVPLIIAGAAVVVSHWASGRSHKVTSQKLRVAFAYLIFAIAIFTITKTWIIH